MSKGNEAHTQTQLPRSQRKERSKQGSVGRVKRPDNRCQGRNTAARGTSRVMQKKVSGTQVSTAVLVPAQPQPLTKCWAQVVKDPKPEVKVAASPVSQKTDIKSRSTKGRASGPGCRGSPTTSQSSSRKVASPPQAAIVLSEPKAKVKSWADVLKTPKPDAAVSPASRKSERGLCKEECVSANRDSASGRQQRGSANQQCEPSTRGRGSSSQGGVSLQSARTASKTWAEEMDEALTLPDEYLQYFRTGTEAGSVWHSDVISCSRARSPSH